MLLPRVEISIINPCIGILNKTFKIAKLSEWHARDYKFDLVNKKDGTVTKDCTVEQYFLKRYNLQLEWPLLPLLETTKKGVLYPMECCIMRKGQKYPYKLDEAQVNMHVTVCMRVIY